MKTDNENSIPMKPLKKIFIKTYGCQMNVYDSQRMVEILKPFNYEETSSMDEADMIILNTCHIREKATEKIFSILGRLKKIKNNRKDLKIAVAGCVAQAEGGEILRRAPYVDLIFGPQNYHKLPEMIALLHRSTDTTHSSQASRGIIETNFLTESKFDFLPLPVSHESSAFVSIQEGCDKFCTFCVVPYTRGAEYSRPVEKIIQDVKHLIHQGVIEITLLGQNVNAYHGEAPDGTEWDLGRLLYALANIPNLQRLRYTTSHPRDVNASLIAAHRDIPQLMPLLHLPVQSGSDKILKAMNRKHTIDMYKRIIDQFKEARSDIQFSSDFIIGFPGESEEDFQQTLALVDTVKFIQAYAFKYSPRPGTPGSVFPYQVKEDVKKERLMRLQDRLKYHQIRFNETCLNQDLWVLFDRNGQKEGQIVGRSPFMQPVCVQTDPSIIGKIQKTNISHAQPHSLMGVLV